MSQDPINLGGTASALSADSTKETRNGLFFALAAYGSWGLFPLYFSLLAEVPSVEVVANRIVWSLAMMTIWFLLLGRWREVWSALRQPKVFGILALTGFLISGNWLTYVWAVGHGRATEASLGYYIVPLVNVATGYLLLSERPSRLQLVAIVIAFLAIALQIILLGTIPIVSLLLAFTFGSYGYLRKIVPVGANLGLLIELIIVAPFALVYVVYLQSSGLGHLSLSDPMISVLILITGILTAFPLIWFSMAARRLRMSTIGIMQYLNPTLQFLVAVFLLNETVPAGKLVTFGLIWLSVLIYSYDAYRSRRREPRPPALQV
ncbi:chloramphenicol-sensitive protein RarD [Cohaesibacter sp. ES.047]|uniref:EamA family transporter RarD n=1 Tax=Cohaesibacter sp. ES.047 TaxID=1798205 RepID=UPI000BB6CF8C|nr:EamA family transporter RarD [Cohaesibacter sp. ES.047]SNY93855.1 chloramphenicol-sensitive protein RarD [Cohaesibacter sp. ES.047]